MLKPETLEQIAVFDWIRCHKNIFPYAFHIPNEGKRSKIMGKILQRMGMRAGISDIFVAIPTGKFHGLWIELKAGTNKATPLQLQFLKDMARKNYATSVCHGSKHAIQTIEDYIAGIHDQFTFFY